jgi:hypothetical protein
MSKETRCRGKSFFDVRLDGMELLYYLDRSLAVAAMKTYPQ